MRQPPKLGFRRVRGSNNSAVTCPSCPSNCPSLRQLHSPRGAERRRHWGSGGVNPPTRRRVMGAARVSRHRPRHRPTSLPHGNSARQPRRRRTRPRQPDRRGPRQPSRRRDVDAVRIARSMVRDRRRVVGADDSAPDALGARPLPAPPARRSARRGDHPGHDRRHLRHPARTRQHPRHVAVAGHARPRPRGAPSAFAQAQRWGWVWDNPTQHAHRIVVAPAELHPPTPAELSTLLTHVASVDSMFHTFVLLAATKGARRAQLLGLRWDNVRRDTMRVAFCAGWVEGPDGPTLAPTKTKRRHSVDLDVVTFATLGRARRRRRRGVRVQRRRGSDRMEAQPRHEGLRSPTVERPGCASSVCTI